MTVTALPVGSIRSRALSIVVVTAVMVAAVVSVATSFVRPESLGGRPSGGAVHRISDDVSTSFGIVAVEFVRQIDGVTHRSLAGASHGVSGLVTSGHAQIQVAVAITNRTELPIEYTSDQFRLRITRNGKSTVQKIRGGDLPDARVLPHAGIEGHLDFTVPRRNATLALLFNDLGRSEPIVIDLGPADFSASRGTSEHTTH